MKILGFYTTILCFFFSSCGEVNQIAPYNREEKIANYANVHANVKDLDEVHTFNVLNRPSEDYLKTLVEELTDGIDDVQEKSKIIHDWIVINIFYDLDRYYDPQDLRRPYFYLEVLRGRLTMCGGYTDLFFVMAKMAGIRVSSVTGAAANAHIWNAVWDGSQWMHIDCTWDAGSFQNGTLKPSYSSTHFWKSAAEIVLFDNHDPGSGFEYEEDASPYSDY